MTLIVRMMKNLEQPAHMLTINRPDVRMCVYRDVCNIVRVHNNRSTLVNSYTPVQVQYITKAKDIGNRVYRGIAVMNKVLLD